MTRLSLGRDRSSYRHTLGVLDEELIDLPSWETYENPEVIDVEGTQWKSIRAVKSVVAEVRDALKAHDVQGEIEFKLSKYRGLFVEVRVGDAWSGIRVDWPELLNGGSKARQIRSMIRALQAHLATPNP